MNFFEKRTLPLISAAALAAMLLGACEPNVREVSSPALERRATPIQVIAVMPFDLVPALRDDPQRFADSNPLKAARLVENQVTDTLRARNVRTVPSSEVRLALGAAAAAMPLPEATRIVAERFAADALLIGRVARWTERSGTAASATRGATVAFEIILFDAPGAKQLWSGTFDRTQRPLSENILQAPRLPGGGSRWLTAEELARWGAERTARQLPLN